MYQVQQICLLVVQLEDRHKQQLARWFAAQLASGKLAAS